MKHNFKESLAKGKAGEALLLKLWPELVPTDGRKGDFMLGPNKVEVKSDNYSMDTGNFFMERWSDFLKQKPGGVWQALQHEANIFVYWYPKDKIAFIFDSVILKNALEDIIKDLTPVQIPNVAWLTIGFKVPRQLLEPYFTIKDFNEPNTRN